MSYEVTTDGSIIKAVKYSKPGKFTRRSSSGMKRWTNRQLEYDKNPTYIQGLTFVQWLKLLKEKRLILDEI